MFLNNDRKMEMPSRRIAAAILVLAAGTAAFLTWGHDFLCFSETHTLQPMDLVVALAGPLGDEDRERVLTAADLVAADQAPRLLLPVRHRALEWPWFVRNYRIKAPLSEDRVIVGHMENSKSGNGIDLGGTFAEAKQTLEFMRKNHFRSAIIVSSCYHMRRARLAFERANQDPALVFYFHPVDVLDPDDSGPWWRKWGYVAKVADEYIKLLGGYLFYR